MLGEHLKRNINGTSEVVQVILGKTCWYNTNTDRGNFYNACLFSVPLQLAHDILLICVIVSLGVAGRGGDPISL